MLRTLRTICLPGLQREPSVVTFEVRVPIITNSQDIAAGEELLVLWNPTRVQAASKRKLTGWDDQVRAQLAAEKKKVKKD